MYKKSSLIILVCLIVFIGCTSQVFAVNFFDALTQSAKDTKTAATLFAGKAQVSNLYSQSLHIVKQNEISATHTAIRTVVTYFLKKSCKKVDADDVLNILYYDNDDASFRIFFQHLLLTELSNKTPGQKAINSSYNTFFACDASIGKGKDKHPPTQSDYNNVKSMVKSLYYQALDGVFYSSTLAQDNIGEDLFWNGNTGDSAFDLLIDINDIGNLFFATFKQVPEVLFYRLPSISSAGGGGNQGSSPGSSLPGNGGGSGPDQTSPGPISSDWTRGIGLPPSQAPLGSKTLSDAALNDFSLPSSVSPDHDVQQFLMTNNPSTFVQPSTSFLVGNSCTDTQQLPSSQATVQELTEDPEVYMSGLVSFINNANTDDVAQATLLQGFAKDFAAVKTNNSTYKTQVAAISNSYASLAFGTGNIGNGTCESSCLSLTGGDYVQCQLKCTKSCIAQCNDLPLADRFLCVTDCSCKMISGPQGEGREKVEDMYSIKFCKQPLPTITIPGRVTVTSIEGIFTSFFNVLQGLKSSGQTTKIKKTREFLDLGISLKLSDNLDFNIIVNFKPVFGNKASATKQRQQAIEAARLANAQINQASTPDADNYNKYIIISDVSKNTAQLESFNDPHAEARIVALQAATSSLPDPIQLYQEQKNALFSEDIIGFLASQVVFWDQFYLVSNDLLQDAIRLKNKINDSK